MSKFFIRFCVAVLVPWLFVGGALADEPDATPPEDPQNFHLILLVGQSNMAGRGKVTDADRVPHPRVLMLNKQQEWVPAIDPLHFDKPGIVGVGLGRTFAIEYAKAHPDATVGLIPCAVGGSPIDSWDVGGYHEQTKTHPWDDMLPRAKKALESGTLKAILWHQGESDSTAKRAPVYEQKLRDLIGRMRDEFARADVPFLIGQLGQFFSDKPWTEFRKMVDRAHRTICDDVAHTAFVESDGLGHKGDKTHFAAASYREFGKRYFAAYKKLVQPVPTEL